eukprot:FR735680.1.p2 GENE.FR735680.1~~FR735680.1.p2  ORF type:complete len:143 (-),score=39.19 FR735680.1:581-1009(-)
MWRGNQFSPQKTVMAQDFPQAANLTLIKGEQKGEFPPGGGRFRNRGSLWFGTWGVTHCGRLFFFLFYIFFFYFFYLFFSPLVFTYKGAPDTPEVIPSSWPKTMSTNAKTPKSPFRSIFGQKSTEEQSSRQGAPPRYREKSDP